MAGNPVARQRYWVLYRKGAPCHGYKNINLLCYRVHVGRTDDFDRAGDVGAQAREILRRWGPGACPELSKFDPPRLGGIDLAIAKCGGAFAFRGTLWGKRL